MGTLRDKVVVITGASSGLGRATSIECAKRGARVVLAARRNDALEDTARACRSAGGEAIVVETDVTIEAEVEALAQAALDAYGRIDVWINNAGVTFFSRLEDAEFDVHQRVIETNLFGAMHGARAAVPVFRRQRRGVLINISSVLGEIGHAFVPSYVISKFGVHGLSEALRVELADEPDIDVCTVFPYAIDTPHFEEAANDIDHEIRAMPPVQSPEKVARAIADVAQRPRRVRFVPRAAVLGLALHAIMPRAVERLLRDSLARWHLGNKHEPATTGNLFEAPRGELAHTHGDRPPQIGTLGFFAWAVARFVVIEVEAVRRVVRRALAAPAPA